MLVRLTGDGTLYEQLYGSLRTSILGGATRPGDRLPASRLLADELGVSRTTVVSAYEQLVAEGYAVARQGSGTFVAPSLPDEATAASSTLRAPAREDVDARLSVTGRRAVGEGLRWRARRPLPRFDLRYGRPAIGEFPHEMWSRLIARRVRRLSQHDLDYPPLAGTQALREAVAAYLLRARGAVTDPEGVCVTSGSQQALDLTTRMLVDEGDPVAVEDPYYPGARSAAEVAGAKVHCVPVDGQGLSVEVLARIEPAPRVVYVTPSHHFPKGELMPLARRLELLAWAEHNDAFIVEDDYDSEFRYRGRPVESLQGLDGGRRVIYIGTLSKLLAPSLRIGFAVLPPALMGAFLALKAVGDAGSPVLEQYAAADFIAEGHFDRHIRRCRMALGERRARMIDTIAGAFGERAKVEATDAGLYLLLWFPELPGKASPALARAAYRRGVGVHPITAFSERMPEEAGVVVGYGTLAPSDFTPAIEALADAVRDLRP